MNNLKQHKSNLTQWMGALVLVSSFFILPSALADISATVYPGYQFSTGEKPTTDKLNLLARPTINVFGTLGGTNVAIGANTINGSMMVNTFPDGLTLDWDTNAPRRMKIFNGGVSVAQVSSNLLGQGLQGGNGSRVAVRAEAGYFKFSSSTNYADTNTLQFNARGLFVPVYTNQVAITNGLTNYFAYTNSSGAWLYTNDTALSATDSIPIYSQAQAGGTNTTVTLGALGQYISSVIANPIKAYGLFNGTTPPTTLLSNNVASITRSSQGVYVVNLVTNLNLGANYAVIATLAGRISDGDVTAIGVTSRTTTNFTIVVKQIGVVNSDANGISFQVLQ